MTSIKRFSIEDPDGIKLYYDEHGIVIIDNLLNPADLADVKEDLKNIIRWNQVKADLPETEGDVTFSLGLQSLEDKDREYVGAIYDTIYQTPSFMRLVSNPLLEKYVKILLKLDCNRPLYGYTNRCLFAPPQDERRTYGWHQEVFYTIPDSHYIQTWAPLVFDTTTASGTIEVRLGSHKEKVAKQTWNDVPGRTTQIIVDETIVDKYPTATIEMKLGEIALFSGFLFHRSGQNISAQFRYSLVGMFHDVGHKEFMTPKINFSYRRKTPREYYDELFPSSKTQAV